MRGKESERRKNEEKKMKNEGNTLKERYNPSLPLEVGPPSNTITPIQNYNDNCSSQCLVTERG